MQIPGHIKLFLLELSGINRFAIRFFKEVFVPPYEIKEVVKQSFRTGYKSLALVGLTGFIMGLVVTLQSRPTLVEFGAAAYLPSMVSVSIFREIGPIVTALMCAGKVGSNIGAELGSMRVTEQLDAMEASGANPFKYVVVTRIVGITAMVPILVMYADFFAMAGAYVAANLKSNISFALFFYKIFEKMDFLDFVPSVIKSVFFGFSIGLISSYLGYYSNKGTEGVGRSANLAVVFSSLVIFIIDLLAVQITNAFVKYG